MKLYITTLGVFDMKMNEESLLKESNRSYRIYKLFQYFLTFRNKKLLAESIIDNLWQESESFDPKNMLRAQIFRLRQTINKMLPKDDTKYLSISFSNGYYTLETGENTEIDVDIFEQLIAEGDKQRLTDTNLAISAYKMAINLYKGPYLEENPYEIWLVPVRNYYNRLYLKTLYKIIELLKEKESYEDIVELCEQAIGIEPYEENIHIYLMEAMLKLGQINNAQSHYEYIIAIFEKEMRSISSPAMRDIYRKIQNNFTEKSDMDIYNINHKLIEEDIKGPMFCDSDHFKFLFNLQKRKRDQGVEQDYISLITLNCDHCIQDDFNRWKKMMTEVLENSLRRGDVFTFWNDSQVLIMLSDVKENGIDTIESRILNNLPKHMNYNININFTSINQYNNQTIESPI